MVMAVGCGKETPEPEQTPPDQNRTTQAGELEGTWVGHELDGPEGNWTFKITADKVSVTGVGQEWYKGALTVDESASPKQADFRIEQCFAPDGVGLTSLSIYKIEGNTFTLAANEPGAETRPTEFVREPNARVFVLTKTK